MPEANKQTREDQISKAMERDIDERTTAIWGWVREHRHSLSSEVGYRKMREAIDAATESLRYQLVPLLEEIEQLEMKVSKIKAKAIDDCDERDRTIKALQKDVKATRKDMEELRAKAVEVN